MLRRLVGVPKSLGVNIRCSVLAPEFRRLYNTLGDLQPPAGATRQQNRVGRGPGSGRGKTSGRGTKGQKARGKVRPHFEGGQTPITKLFPKVGFKSKLPQPVEVNLGTIQNLIDDKRLDPSKPITMRELYLGGCISSSSKNGVKILSRGASRLKQAITLSASKATSSAIAAIESVGGSFTAQFYPEFNMKVLTHPENFYRKYARIPLRARPVSRRNIEFYRDESHRGYLANTPGAPQIKPVFEKRSVRESPLVAKLKALRESDGSVNGARQGFL